MGFKVGDQVKISNINGITNRRFVGETGTIVKIFDNTQFSYGVTLASNYFIFFTEDEIELINDAGIPDELIESIVNTFRVYASEEDLIGRAANLLILNELITEKLAALHPNHNKETGAFE